VSFAGTAMAVFLIENHDKEYENIIKALLCMFLALPLFISINIWAKSINASSLKRGIAIVLGVCCILLYYFSIKDIDSNHHAYRFGGLFIAMHLLVSFIPYLNNKSIASFWNYNRTLFLRAVESGLFSLVIFAGIALAILALDKLFGVDFDDVIYGQLFFTIIGIFNTLYFLAGFPENFDEGLQDQAYPRPLSIFCKYISIPIVFVYFIILYAFTIKIGISWEWPQGWISKLILCFSVLGILVYLLSYYLNKQDDSTITKWFKKGYFFALFPMSIVLLLALWRRFSDYGITENRYIVSMLGIWLFCISVYFILSKKDNIKAIPISLFAFILFGLFSGPLNIFNFPANNQVHRLESLLIKHQLLKNGKIRANSDLENEQEVSIEISNAITYITNNDHQDKIYPWFDQQLDTMARYPSPYLNALDLKYEYNSGIVSNETFHNYYSKDFINLSISEYDYYGYHIGNRFNIQAQTYNLNIVDNKDLQIININEKVLASFDLMKFLTSLKTKDIQNGRSVSQEQLKYQFENENYILLLLPRNLNFTELASGEILNYSMEASFFIKVKQSKDEG
jgi:hypothetical protein